MLHADQLTGKTLGHYDIHELIGEGGMAYVYKATDQNTKETVAIKVLFPEHTRQEETKLRFKREAQIQFELAHPNLVKVHGLLDEEGILGMAMEFVSGKDLKDYLKDKDGLPTLQEVQRIVLPVLKVIGFAHEKQIVHRDLKPANIVLQGDSGREMPKVMDFGIAKSFTDTGWKTKTGLILGTPNYMSPELVLGKKIDHRVDIYALGIMLYQMVTGELPFQGDDAISVIMAQCSREAPPLKTWLHEPDPRLESIIMKSISKDPAARFQSCDEFAQALASLPQSEIILEPAKNEEASASTMIFDGDELPSDPAMLTPQPVTPQPTAPPPATPQPHPAVAAPPLHPPVKKSGSNMMMIALIIVSIGLTGVLFYLIGQRSNNNPIQPTPEGGTTTRKVEPRKVEPRKVEPRKVEPRKVEPRKVEPRKVKPRKVVKRPPPRQRRCGPGSKSKCRRCVSRNFRKLLLSMNGFGGRSGYCQISDVSTVAKQCRRSCGCDYKMYCKAYLNQSFRSKKGKSKAGYIRLCRHFVSTSRVLRSVRRYYGKSASRATAKQCQRTWRK
ncbi:MAG: hypothetical protein CL920_26100 [Deltaproteobacteria bacterium]|nr:hypothetical protein [Deltaproteobacteria bacterium]